MADPDYMRLVRYESELIRFIQLRMNTLRLANILPTWTNYVSSGPDWRSIEPHLTYDAKKKFRGYWLMMWQLMRHPKDFPSVQLAIAYLVREKQRRSYAKEFFVDPAKFGVPSDHAERVEEFALVNYESLNPDKL